MIYTREDKASLFSPAYVIVNLGQEPLSNQEVSIDSFSGTVL